MADAQGGQGQGPATGQRDLAQGEPPAVPSAVDATVLPAGWRFTVPAGVCLVTAAQQAGIRLARSCRNGTCRACLCHLRSGQVRYSIEWPGLSADEKDEGCILPCVAHPLTDVVLDAPNATLIDPAA